MRSLRHVVATLVAVVGAASTTAHGAGAQVGANTRPWESSGVLNPTYSFGIVIGPVPSPTVFETSSLGVVAGGLLRITATGSVSAGQGFSLVDPDGVPLNPSQPTVYAGVINDATGDSGTVFPSRYTPADWGTNLMALMGTFADNAGVIVATPFEVGSSRDVVVPEGATRLQLGINDDVFGDNGGSFDVTVAVVPEPSALGMVAVGTLVLAGLVRRRGRHAHP